MEGEKVIEFLIVAGILALILCRNSGPRFWTPFRGAPNVKSVREANDLTDLRCAVLRSVGRIGDAFAVAFGILRVPLEVLSKPMIVFGLPGTGKTTLLNLILKSLVGLFGKRTGRTRFVFLDVKNELPRRLNHLLPPRVPIYYLNPWDARSSVLDFPATFAARSDIEQLAHSLCPPVPGDQTPYFRNAARSCIALVAWVLKKYEATATTPWGLYHLCVILADKKLLRRVMFCDFEARSFYRSTLGPRNKACGDVLSTIRSAIQPLIPAALVELDGPARLDLKSFVREDGVAVLGIPPTGSQAVIPLFNVFIRRLIEEAQTQAHPDDRLFLVLDEIAMLDRAVVESIVNATCLGRSFGIHVIAATQSLELLEAKFGADQANAFLASCATTVGFRCASRKTAEYIVGRFGNQEGIVTLTSWTRSNNGNSTTTSQQLQIRVTVLAEDILHAPLADPVTDSMTYYALIPGLGNVRVETPFVAETTVDGDLEYPNHSTRIPSAKSLRPLSKVDWVALGLPAK